MTREQEILWEVMRIDRPEVSGTQTPEQAEHLAVASFRFACALDSLGQVSDAEIRNRLRRRC